MSELFEATAQRLGPIVVAKQGPGWTARPDAPASLVWLQASLSGTSAMGSIGQGRASLKGVQKEDEDG